MNSAMAEGRYNLFEAARRKKVRRVVFASSNHAVGYYPRQRRIGVDAPVRPDSRYGVSKAFGEALGAMYAYKHGLRVTCIRIGNFADAPADHRRLSIWLKPEDLVQLIRSGSNIRTYITKYSSAPPPMSAAGGTTSRRSAMAIGRPGMPKTTRPRRLKRRKPSLSIRPATGIRAVRFAATTTTPGRFSRSERRLTAHAVDSDSKDAMKNSGDVSHN
jgi:hypothetical protein